MQDSDDSIYWSVLILVAFIGVGGSILGAYIGGTMTASNEQTIYQEQLQNEQRNIAKAFDVDIEHVNEAIDMTYQNFANQKSPNYGMYPISKEPFYNLDNGLYPIFAHDISRFNYSLSSEIFEFYSSIYIAERDRQFIIQNRDSNNKEIKISSLEIEPSKEPKTELTYLFIGFFPSYIFLTQILTFTKYTQMFNRCITFVYTHICVYKDIKSYSLNTLVGV
jgi:hypothetical protein